MKKGAISLAFLAMGLSACSTSTSSGRFAYSEDTQLAAILHCKNALNVPGPYVTLTIQYGSSAREVQITPEKGIGRENAKRINVCARDRLLASSPQPASTPELQETVVARAGVARGKVPLPSEYPLMPGDEQLWAQMTEAQQQRALQFLSGGSTIRSSLSGDE